MVSFEWLPQGRPLRQPFIFPNPWLSVPLAMFTYRTRITQSARYFITITTIVSPMKAIHHIHFVDAQVTSTGMMSLFAGIPGQGMSFSGDGGPATAATFRCPIVGATTSSGDVFIVDQLNNRIRKVQFVGTHITDDTTHRFCSIIFTLPMSH